MPATSSEPNKRSNGNVTLRPPAASSAKASPSVPDPLTLLVDCLAVFRLTRLIVEDGILDRPRAWVLTRFPGPNTEFYDDALPTVPHRLVPIPGSRPRLWVAETPTWLGRLLECPWCVSVWCAAAVVAVSGFGWWVWPARILAYSAIAGMLHQHSD